MVMALTLFVLCAGLASCVALLVYDPIHARVEGYLHKKTDWATHELETMFVDVTHRRLQLSFLIGPLAGGIGGWLVLHRVVGIAGGALIGMIIPQLYIARMKARRYRQFQAQLVDALMLMSSSLKAGLSILQAFEVIVEEMPPPISQEIGLLLKENKMGVSLEDSLSRLKRRMPSDDLNLVTTAVMVARETGGDVTEVFGRLIETMRDRQKLKERVTTLTVQARIQGVIMMILPIAFAVLAYSFNPKFFDIFFSDPTGRALLLLAVTLEIVGAFLIWLFGRVHV